MVCFIRGMGFVTMFSIERIIGSKKHQCTDGVNPFKLSPKRGDIGYATMTGCLFCFLQVAVMVYGDHITLCFDVNQRLNPGGKQF